MISFPTCIYYIFGISVRADNKKEFGQVDLSATINEIGLSTTRTHLGIEIFFSLKRRKVRFFHHHNRVERLTI